MSNPSNVIKFLHIIENLKRTKRTGWVDSGIQNAESIGDHMHRMGVMAMLIDDPTLDREKCIKMAIVHDLAEAVVGDITPHAGVSKEEKYRQERLPWVVQGCFRLIEVFRMLINQPSSPQTAIESYQSLLGDSNMAKEITSLWQEYEDAATPEALLVKDLDKFEMIVQALEYEKSDKKQLQSFFNSTNGKFKHPTVKAWAEALYAERNAHLGNSQ